GLAALVAAGAGHFSALAAAGTLAAAQNLAAAGTIGRHDGPRLRPALVGIPASHHRLIAISGRGAHLAPGEPAGADQQHGHDHEGCETEATHAWSSADRAARCPGLRARLFRSPRHSPRRGHHELETPLTERSAGAARFRPEAAGSRRADA